MPTGQTDDTLNAPDISLNSIVNDEQFSAYLPVLWDYIDKTIYKYVNEELITADAAANLLTQVMPSITGQVMQFSLQSRTAALQALAAEADVKAKRIIVEQEQYTLDNILPARLKLLNEQIEEAHAATSDTRTDGNPVAGTLGAQKDLSEKRIDLVGEQIEQARATTADTRTDGSDIAGSVGKQKELFVQQIKSYKNADLAKYANLHSNLWSVRKSSDRGVAVPDSLKDANFDSAVAAFATAVDADIDIT